LFFFYPFIVWLRTCTYSKNVIRHKAAGSVCSFTNREQSESERAGRCDRKTHEQTGTTTYRIRANETLQSGGANGRTQNPKLPFNLTRAVDRRAARTELQMANRFSSICITLMRSGAFIELKRLFLATVVHRIHVDTSIRLATSVDYVHAPHLHSMYVYVVRSQWNEHTKPNERQRRCRRRFHAERELRFLSHRSVFIESVKRLTMTECRKERQVPWLCKCPPLTHAHTRTHRATAWSRAALSLNSAIASSFYRGEATFDYQTASSF